MPDSPPKENDDRRLRPDIPFLWPDSRVLTGSRCYAEEPPYAGILRSSHCILGQVHGVAAAGVRALAELAQMRPPKQIWLVIVVYPAAPTGSRELLQLARMQEGHDGECQFRLVAADLSGETASNFVCCYREDRSLPVMLPGPATILQAVPFTGPSINLALRPTPELADQWRRWFDWRWRSAVPLTERTAHVPALIPAQGTPEAARAWSDYLALLAGDQTEGRPGVEVDPDTGEVVQDPEEGEETVSESLGLAKLSMIDREVAKLSDKGKLVTIDKATRLPPLDAPMKPAWFGVERFRQEGAVTRKVEYRLSVMDERILRSLETKRKKTSGLLAKFTFALADGARWMPDAAKPLFEREQDRTNSEGHALLADTIGEHGVEGFVESQRECVTTDANKMYRELRPEGELASNVIDEILADLKARLTRAAVGRFLPSLSYSSVSFVSQHGGEWTSPWGQAYHLLREIAQFPRRLLSDRYFLRGLRVEEDELIQAMDVCEDVICKALDDRKIVTRAKEELDLLDDIGRSRAPVEKRCEAILGLMRGGPPADILKELDKSGERQ